MIEYTVTVDGYGTHFWYLNGQLHREDGPAVEYTNGTRYWFLNGQRHRKDGPAIEYANGAREWFLNGQRHRLDGPAVEWADGVRSWYLNDEKVTEEEFNARIKTKETTVNDLEIKMKEMFELEQAILDCWKITDDIPLLEEMQANSVDYTSLAGVYEFKFEKLWRTFEQLSNRIREER